MVSFDIPDGIPGEETEIGDALKTSGMATGMAMHQAPVWNAHGGP